jgi:hypothetical protein
MGQTPQEYGQECITRYKKVKENFATLMVEYGGVYALRHKTADLAKAEYRARHGAELANLTDEQIPEYIKRLGRRLRSVAQGNLDGEFNKYEVAVIAEILEELD